MHSQRLGLLEIISIFKFFPLPFPVKVCRPLCHNQNMNGHGHLPIKKDCGLLSNLGHNKVMIRHFPWPPPTRKAIKVTNSKINVKKPKVISGHCSSGQVEIYP